MSADTPRAAYPLTWPDRQARTPAHLRRRAQFKLSLGPARDELIHELDLLRARNIIVSTNVPTRRDGLPYATGIQPGDPGVAVYFDRRVGQESRAFTIACDSYTKVEWNLRAVGVTVEALRAIQRHGASEMLEQAFTGFAALPAPIVGDPPWFTVLGVSEACSLGQLQDAFRELALIHHPDRGGDTARMAQINRAYDAGKRARS